jgi:hypothetical protein
MIAKNIIFDDPEILHILFLEMYKTLQMFSDIKFRTCASYFENFISTLRHLLNMKSIETSDRCMKYFDLLDSVLENEKSDLNIVNQILTYSARPRLTKEALKLFKSTCNSALYAKLILCGESWTISKEDY